MLRMHSPGSLGRGHAHAPTHAHAPPAALEPDYAQQQQAHGAHQPHARPSQQQQQLPGAPQQRWVAQPLRLVLLALRNPFFWYVSFLGVLLAAAAHTYVFFLPMLINALVNGERAALGLG
jgi:hypothetical protein